jgi:hypothetical protein
MADGSRVALFIPNLFVRVPVESAVRAAGSNRCSQPRRASATTALAVLDLDACGETRWRRSPRSCRPGRRWRLAARAAEELAARRAGAVVLPRWRSSPGCPSCWRPPRQARP